MQNLIKGAIDSAKERVRRNYKTRRTSVLFWVRSAIAAAQPYGSHKKADLALVVEKFADFL